MKKILSFIVFVLCYNTLFAASFGLLINGTTTIEAVHLTEKDFEDRDQFLAACVTLNQGDKVQLYNFDTKDKWMCAIDPYGEHQKFTKNTDHLICNASGSYDFYIKLKYGDDMLYIGPGQNCSVEFDPTNKYYITGNSELVGGNGWTAKEIVMTANIESETYTHTFTELVADVVYRMKITNGTWDQNWGFSAVQNVPTGVVADTDGNIVFALATTGNVEVIFDGRNITLIGNFTDEDPIKPIHGSSVPSECEDVMLQAFYYDSYRDGAPGDVVLHDSTTLGNTKWSTLLNQSGEIGTYFDLVWLPPSGKSEGGTGYHQTQYSNQNSDWGKQKDLLEFINRMHAANTKVVADIVINHAGCKSSWCDFYPQNFGEFGTFQPDASWICKTDEVNFNPEAGEWKGKATGTDDGGYNMQDNYASARDWAHADPRVQEMMKAYLKWMKEEIGFDGWRYDYAQGFKGKYIDMYNNAAANYFSVVEFWNGDMNNIKSYLNDVNWNTFLILTVRYTLDCRILGTKVKR